MVPRGLFGAFCKLGEKMGGGGGGAAEGWCKAVVLEPTGLQE